MKARGLFAKCSGAAAVILGAGVRAGQPIIPLIPSNTARLVPSTEMHSVIIASQKYSAFRRIKRKEIWLASGVSRGSHTFFEALPNTLPRNVRRDLRYPAASASSRSAFSSVSAHIGRNGPLPTPRQVRLALSSSRNCFRISFQPNSPMTFSSIFAHSEPSSFSTEGIVTMAGALPNL